MADKLQTLRSFIQNEKKQASLRLAVLGQTVVENLLRKRHHLILHAKPDDFTIQNQADILKTQNEAAETFTGLIGGIAAISLFVGGIGILAIMLMVIRERTGEIGLRMALGARKKDVLIQFLLESLILSIGGGFLGIVLGIGGSVILGFFTSWSTSVSILSIVIAFVFSFIVGLFFGVYPARRASLLDPIEALRSE